MGDEGEAHSSWGRVDGGDDVCSPWLLWKVFFLGRCVGYDGPGHRYGGCHLIYNLILLCPLFYQGTQPEWVNHR